MEYYTIISLNIIWCVSYYWPMLSLICNVRLLLTIDAFMIIISIKAAGWSMCLCCLECFQLKAVSAAIDIFVMEICLRLHCSEYKYTHQFIKFRCDGIDSVYELDKLDSILLFLNMNFNIKVFIWLISVLTELNQNMICLAENIACDINIEIKQPRLFHSIKISSNNSINVLGVCLNPRINIAVIDVR